MSNVIQIPEAVPWWLVLIVIIPLGIYFLMLIAMPFTVFGLKGRLESIDARIDELHADIRSLVLRQQSCGVSGQQQDEPTDMISAPPIAPSRTTETSDFRIPQPGEAPKQRREAVAPGTRTEPRLQWPK